jgi:heptosyltransferase-3
MASKPVKRILIYRIGQLGDTIIALPALWSIRQHFPSAHLALLSDEHPQKGYISASQVLPAGLIDQYLGYEANPEGGSLVKLLRLLPRLRQERFDTLVYLAPRLRSRRQVWRDLVFFRVAGIRRFMGHRGIRPYPPVIPGKPLPQIEHMADYFLGLLAQDGIPVPPPGEGCMNLGVEKAELKEAEDWLHSRVGSEPGKLLIGLGVGSKYPAKVWPEERYERLGQHLIDQLGAFPIIFGGLEDQEIGHRLLSKWKLGANAAGELKVRQAAAALSFCRLYVGNDTGTMHLAAAAGTRCVGIFSARHFPGVWYPYGFGHMVLRRHVPCEGCLTTACANDTACLKLISVEDAMDACRQALGESRKGKS